MSRKDHSMMLLYLPSSCKTKQNKKERVEGRWMMLSSSRRVFYYTGTVVTYTVYVVLVEIHNPSERRKRLIKYLTAASLVFASSVCFERHGFFWRGGGCSWNARMGDVHLFLAFSTTTHTHQGSLTVWCVPAGTIRRRILSVTCRMS